MARARGRGSSKATTNVTPLPLNEAIRARFARTARRDTGPERRLRSSLHSRGLRFYVDRSPIAGVRSRADIVFPRRKVAVFVDGCFWHGCEAHGTLPKHNAEWWRSKIAANRARDARVTALLVDSGWTVVRVWEHEDVATATERVLAALR